MGPATDRTGYTIYQDQDMQDEKHPSPDSAGSAMTLTTGKKDKTCLVCGDKALGYNFNAISCESCKAFFRRNAHKTIRGRCEGKCDVNVESRSFCKKCRLAKCFTVGMRKDMILDDTQKTLRKQKIIINKLRRHGSLPPEDTYDLSETEMEVKQVYRQQIISQSYESLKAQFPSLSDEELNILRSIKSEDKSDSKLEYSQPKSSSVSSCSSWDDSSEIIEKLVLEMSEPDGQILMEMIKAYESSSFLSNTQTELKSVPSSPTEVFNIADGFVRRIIKVAKQIDFFRALDKEDQIALLKGSVVEIMMFRSAVNFNLKTETWSLNTSSCIAKTNARSRSASISSATSSVAPTLSSPVPGDSQLPFDFSLPRNDNDNTANLQGVEARAAQAVSRMGSATRINSMKGDIVMNGIDINAMRNFAINKGMDVDALRKATAQGASFDTLRNMGRGMSRQSIPVTSPVLTQTDVPPELYKQFPSIPAGMNMNQLRQLGASLGFCSPSNAKDDNYSKDSESGSSSISADILKSANPETRQMFSTYSKFIRSLMHTICGDLVILKFLIMLSLFSPDRGGILGVDLVHKHQEVYARVLQVYISKRYPMEKSMFAKSIMKLTDVRNINDVHTKMLLKMRIDDIEPLLIEIFDLPT